MIEDEKPQEIEIDNIRDVLHPLIGQKLIDITQHDPDDWALDHQSFICLMFDSGATLTIDLGDTGSIDVDLNQEESKE